MRRVNALNIAVALGVVGAAESGAGPHNLPESGHAFAIVNEPQRIATLYASGQAITTRWQSVWRPICGTPAQAMSSQDLLQHAHRHEVEMEAMSQAGQLDEDQLNAESPTDGAGINIVFNLGASVPAAAMSAFDDAEAYLEGRFDDPITVTINVSFHGLEPGVLGQTGSSFSSVSWSQSRAGLVNGMDGNDNLQNYLPTGSTIPVRYNGSSSAITNETRVFWTRANFRATIGAVSGLAGSMIFNSNFSWDYDPSNGVNGYSFQDVLIHEVGHVLGFDSGIDFRINDIEALDIFRFQRTDGSADYNPDSKSEFRVRPRLADFNKPNGQHICDLITTEYRMSDGLPFQASHFRNLSSSIGLMDPALGSSTSRYLNFYSSADLAMFDVIGYDR